MIKTYFKESILKYLFYLLNCIGQYRKNNVKNNSVAGLNHTFVMIDNPEI